MSNMPFDVTIVVSATRRPSPRCIADCRSCDGTVVLRRRGVRSY